MKVTNVSVKMQDGRRHSRTRVYFFPKGENVLENLMHRFSRPSKAYKQLLVEVLEKANLPYITDIKAMAKKTVWSQRAGCQCGCSPGFVINGGWSYGRDIFVDVEGDDALVDPAKGEVTAFRAAQLGLAKEAVTG